MKKQSLLKSTIIFLVILGFLSIGFLGCVPDKPVIPVKSALPAGLSPQVEATLLAGVYTLEDYNLAQSLMAEGKTNEMKVFPVKFVLQEKRFAEPKGGYAGGAMITDGKKIAHINFFEIKGDLEKAKGDFMYSYSEQRTREFDKNIVSTVRGKFCPKLPDQEVSIYKLKCFINGHVRYLTVMNGQINGKDYFAVFYNTNSPNPKMGDVLAMFLNSLQQMPPSS